MKKIFIIGFILGSMTASAQDLLFSEQVAATVMNKWKDSFPLGSTARWSYDMGVILKGFEGLWRNSGAIHRRGNI